MINIKYTSYSGTEHTYDDNNPLHNGTASNRWGKVISWEHDNVLVRLQADYMASFAPFINKNKVVVLYQKQLNFPSPNNLVIYNVDGSVFKVVPPINSFLHPYSLSRILDYQKRNKEKFVLSPIITSLLIKVNQNNIEFLKVSISEEKTMMPSDESELRLLNVDNGEWDLKYRKFDDPNAANGYGKTYD